MSGEGSLTGPVAAIALGIYGTPAKASFTDFDTAYPRARSEIHRSETELAHQ